jgi:tetratricopeptide (TPR) repeat protein
MRICEDSLDLFRQTDDQIGTAWCLETLANNMVDARARELADEARALFQKLGSLDGEARALRALGTCAYRAGDHMRAAQFYEQANAVAHKAEDWWEICACLDRLYDVDPRRALELCVQELAYLRERDYQWNESHLAWVLQTYGVLLVAEGEYVRAQPVLEESVQRGQRADATYYLAMAYLYTLNALGFAELSLGLVDQAVACLEKSRKLSREAGGGRWSYDAELLLASVRIAQGTPAASRDTRERLRHFHKNDLRLQTVCSLLQLADLAARCDDLCRASRLFGAARAFSYEVEARKQWYGRVLWRWHHDAQHTIVEPTLAAARAELGDAEFEAAYAEGQQMTLDQAVAYALQDSQVDAEAA